MPVLALYAEFLGAGPEAIGLIVSVSTLTGVLLKLPSGALSDIYGRRTLMRMGVLAFALPPFAYPFVSDLELLTALRFFHGLATALFAPSALATVTEMYQERRGAALGWYSASTQTGAMIGPVLGGWLMYTSGFATTFVVAGVFGFLGLLLFLSLRLTPPSPRATGQRLWAIVVEVGKGFQAAARNTRVLATSIADAAKMIAKGALMAFLPIYAISIGLNPGEVGVLFGVQGITSLIAKPAMGRTSDIVGRRPLIVAGLGICTASFALIPQVSGLGSLLLLAAFFGFGDAVITSSTVALVADLSELKTLGMGMGLLGTITDIGHASGPLIAGLLIAHFDYAWAFAGIALIQLIAAVMFMAVVKR